VVLTLSGGARFLVLVGPAALGLLLAVAIPPFARWALSWGVGLPFGVVWKIAAEMDEWWKVAVQAAILGVLGVLASIEILRHTARVTLAAEQVQLDLGDDRRTLARTAVGAVYREGDTLVILDRESRPAFRGEPHADNGALERAFRDFGYPWRDADPFAGLYQQWAPGDSRLPVEVDAVLSARAVALRKKAGKEAGELRESLHKLGFTVRDEGDKQFWRPLVSE
jgi:hypothetical protein